MFGFIKNIVTESIGIALVILAVVLFSFFDPFGWFSSGPKLKGTSILVKEVKQIEELISAEYYGEAIASWEVSRREGRLDSDKEEIESLLENISFDLQELDEKEHNRNPDRIGKWKRKEVWRKYKRNFRARYDNQGIYDHVVNILAAGDEKNLIYTIYLDQMTVSDSQQKAISTAYDAEQVESSRNERKKDLIAIGRGIVRAGIDLSGISEDDIFIDESRKTALIRNAEPTIFPVEMNPWFIPERGVKGFEVLRLKGNVSIEEVKIIKSNLKNQLKEQAMDRNILNQAQINAEESLAGFFNLLDDQIEQVKLIYDAIDLIEFEVLKAKQSNTKSISPSHANFLFNSLHSYASLYNSTIDIDRTKKVIESLKECSIDVVYQVDTPEEEIKLDTVRWAFDAYNFLAVRSVYGLSQIEDSAVLNVLHDSSFIKEYWVKSSNLDLLKLENRKSELEKLLLNGEND